MVAAGIEQGWLPTYSRRQKRLWDTVYRIRIYEACHDKRSQFLAKTFSRWQGFITPNRRNFNIVLQIFFVTYLRHGNVHRVALFCSAPESVFGWGIRRAPQVRIIRKNVVHPNGWISGTVPGTAVSSTEMKRGGVIWLWYGGERHIVS